MEGTTNFKDIAELWALLQPSLDQIISAEESGDASQRLPTHTYSQLYSVVYTVCTKAECHQAGVVDQLYKRVGQFVDGYCRERLAPQLRGLPPDRLVPQVLARWGRFTTVLKRITSIFSYLDRHYCQSLRLRTTKEAGVNSFRLLVVDPVVEELSNAVLNGLQAARASSGSVAEPDQLKSVSQMFVELGLDKLFFYQENIEQPYLTQVRSIIDKEMAIARQVLHASTEAKVEQLLPQQTSHQ
ncbi:uncharacterized protein ACA1_203620 [Acanthamoeba castellanii str. Neff]|uniref:Cullin N-terminal domain-containing protein n=1 Tax=Acanthamoeba castellanii (strain ATCC 30010 / Neff) TaxID=1257118 RepID=L8GUK9_ACACF|nr:uncharacterized protein ACA1_203620 [Acanthamoeba castellanii str. Neff]ELR16318.1 hypothetical protein ACA1_203620 [Acanthamoeba castellanii str. Neff]